MLILHVAAEQCEVGQLTKLHGRGDAEFAIQVRDEYQGTGLGTELLQRLLEIARDEGIERVFAEIMPENTGMRRVCSKLGFSFERVPDSQLVLAHIDLTSPPKPATQEYEGASEVVADD